MQVRHFTIIALAWLFMGATCERPVDLEIEEPPAKIVLSSSFTLGEKVKVIVSRTQSLFNPDEPEYLADATVSLYQGDQLIEELILIVPPQERIYPYYTTTHFEPQPATTYTIKAVVNGFDPVYANSFIPESVPITTFALSNLEAIQGNTNYSVLYDYDIFFNFDDPINEKNFYHLNIFQELLEFEVSNIGDIDPDTNIVNKTWKRVDLELDLPGVTSDAIVGGLLFADKPILEGFNFMLNVEIVPEYELLGKVFVEFRTVSEEYFLFYSSFNRRQNQKDGPFTDPITVYNNIENGQGYFAGYNTTQDSVSIHF